jgi:hypothetical protein
MTTTASDGADVAGRRWCWGGINDDGNAATAAKMMPWRTKEQQRRRLPSKQE